MVKAYSVRSHTMLGTSHSWAVSMRSILMQLLKMGHQLHLESINGYKMLDDELVKHLGLHVDEPDLDICYTAPLNFKDRFYKNSKLKMAIYNYETSVLPGIWSDAHTHLDFILPSSKFSKQIFLDAGWPEEKCVVIPHGINLEDFNNKSKYKLKTNRTFKFLNVSINHYRKNIDLVIKAFYDAFTIKDDVCLVIKTNVGPSTGKKLQRFEFDFLKMLKSIQEQYVSIGRVDLPNIEVLNFKFDSMIPLYNSCDALVSASSSEGFGLPLLEALAADKIVIAPDCTGQRDFLNRKNSILIPVDVIKASDKYQYWTASNDATTFMPLQQKLSEAMLDVYKNHKHFDKKFKKARRKTAEKFTWENATKMILDIANEKL